jgi:hypothetical protein
MSEHIIKYHPVLKKSIEILSWTKKSIKNLKKTFQTSRVGSVGTTTDAEQDILRAMLVFSCAWLDAIFKQVFKDALEKLLDKDSTIKDNLKVFIERNLKNPDKNVNIMSWYLLSDKPKLYVVDLWKQDLCSSSLQSKWQVVEVHKKMNIVFMDQSVLDQLDALFGSRNHIIHEMDMLFWHKSRRPRKKSDVYKYVDLMLFIWENFLKEVNKKLNNK